MCVRALPSLRVQWPIARLLAPGDQFLQGGVGEEHADHRHLSEGGVLLQV